MFGRIDWTRTSDLFVPNEAFYQAELQSDTFNGLCFNIFFLIGKQNFKKIFFIADVGANPISSNVFFLAGRHEMHKKNFFV